MNKNQKSFLLMSLLAVAVFITATLLYKAGYQSGKVDALIECMDEVEKSYKKNR